MPAYLNEASERTRITGERRSGSGNPLRSQAQKYACSQRSLAPTRMPLCGSNNVPHDLPAGQHVLAHVHASSVSPRPCADRTNRTDTTKNEASRKTEMNETGAPVFTYLYPRIVEMHEARPSDAVLRFYRKFYLRPLSTTHAFSDSLGRVPIDTC